MHDLQRTQIPNESPMQSPREGRGRKRRKLTELTKHVGYIGTGNCHSPHPESRNIIDMLTQLFVIIFTTALHGERMLLHKFSVTFHHHPSKITPQKSSHFQNVPFYEHTNALPTDSSRRHPTLAPRYYGPPNSFPGR